MGRKYQEKKLLTGLETVGGKKDGEQHTYGLSDLQLKNFEIPPEKRPGENKDRRIKYVHTLGSRIRGLWNKED